ncbi:PhzF family phenazine biosynthesis protein [Kaistia sp. 32K]|uniref:PhzF family phenazine biosynthesis protein n=1 Tax=Kaistia sp. 32K TaxID=2795690 RepID=UPI001915817E|nr:PhzF family phenazine biosynthesis protein [Kaistia sp. 32K]
MSRRFALLDVFTKEPLAGNQLAVVLDSEGLSSERMQAITREFNLAETVFVQPPVQPGHRASLRIFNPAHEMPFAGHPTVGAAVLLALETFGHEAAGQDAVFVVEEKIGDIRCAVALHSGKAGHAIFDVPRQAVKVDTPVDEAALAAMLGLVPSELGFENHRPSVYSVGAARLMVPVRDLAVIARVRPLIQHWRNAMPAGVDSLYLYTRETTTNEHHFHARMLWLGEGIIEDPATGSAVAAFAGVVADFDQLPAGTHRFVIEQGFEINRPSLIHLEVDIENNALHASRIGGDAILVARGTLDV